MAPGGLHILQGTASSHTHWNNINCTTWLNTDGMKLGGEYANGT